MTSLALYIYAYAYAVHVPSRTSVVIMAGLMTAKKYDWKDSNLALFGSDLERNVS